MLFILLFACATCAADATGEKIRQQIDAPVVPTTAKRWGYKTGAAVYSSPLVQTGGGSTGDVIFIGSQDKNVRGSLKLQSESDSVRFLIFLLENGDIHQNDGAQQDG